MHDDLAVLQGRWRIRTLEMDGASLPAMALTLARVVVDGENFTTSGMGATYSGTLSLDPTRVPKLLDMHFTDGPEKGNISLAIYEINDDEWKLCLTVTGSTRPTQFATSPGSGHVLEVLVREHAAAPQDPKNTALPPETGMVDDAEVARFAGNWQGISIVLNGQPLPDEFAKQSTRVVISNTTTVTVAGNVAFQASFSCDPSTSPASIDFQPAVGTNHGKQQLGIYKFDSDQLTICYSGPGKPRPERFESQPGDGRTLGVWKRVP